MVEYVGIVFVVALLLGSITISTTPIGNAIVAKLCQAIGADCGIAIAATEKAPPEDPCVQSSRQEDISGQVSISFVDLGSGKSMLTETLSDGTYRVTIGDSVHLGATLSAGEATAKLKIGDVGGGLDVSADVSAALKLGGGQEYTFDSLAQVEDFQAWAYKEFGRDVAKSVTGPVLGLGVDFGFFISDLITGYDYKPPAPSAVYLEGGVVAGGSASAQVIVAGAEGSIEGSVSLGTRVDTATGDITVYNKVTLDASASAQLGIVSGVHGSAGIETIVETTMNSQGEITGVGWTAVASAEGGATDLTLLASGAPLTEAAGKGVTMSASYPVTDANRDQTHAFLRAMGVSTLAGGPAMTQALAIPWILDEARANGDITVQTLDVSKDNIFDAALALKAPAVGGLGFEAQAGVTSTSTNDAWYLGNSGWVKWKDCVG
ncbi:MAG: hypothetical protein FWD18_05575 [Micrococcales bacterium]|nr:hypothetical protein [Micrococcales bacterium]